MLREFAQRVISDVRANVGNWPNLDVVAERMSKIIAEMEASAPAPAAPAPAFVASPAPPVDTSRTTIDEWIARLDAFNEVGTWNDAWGLNPKKRHEERLLSLESAVEDMPEEIKTALDELGITGGTTEPGALTLEEIQALLTTTQVEPLTTTEIGALTSSDVMPMTSTEQPQLSPEAIDEINKAEAARLEAEAAGVGQA